MKILSAILMCAILSGCVVYPIDGYVTTSTGYTTVAVEYEPDVYVGQYYVGYYQPGFGFWTGYGWDINFYYYGHAGYGHYYRGCPHEYYHNYEGGRYYRGHNEYRHDEYRHDNDRRDYHRDNGGYRVDRDEHGNTHYRMPPVQQREQPNAQRPAPVQRPPHRVDNDRPHTDHTNR